MCHGRKIEICDHYLGDGEPAIERDLYIYIDAFIYIYTPRIYIYGYIYIYIYMAPFFQLPYSQHPHHGTRARPPCCRVYLRYLRTEGSDEFVHHLHCEMEKIPE
jgi:hypothetical protein